MSTSTHYGEYYLSNLFYADADIERIPQKLKQLVMRDDYTFELDFLSGKDHTFIGASPSCVGRITFISKEKNNPLYRLVQTILYVVLSLSRLTASGRNWHNLLGRQIWEGKDIYIYHDHFQNRFQGGVIDVSNFEAQFREEQDTVLRLKYMSHYMFKALGDKSGHVYPVREQ